MKKNLFLSCCFSLFLFGSLWAQDRTVSGTVTSEDDGTPLAGVSVIVKGTTRGVNTDATGKFQFSVPTSATKLVFSFVGFEKKEIPLGTRSEMNVGLKSDNQLGEVIVTGYGGALTKREITGSISSVKGKLIEICLFRVSTVRCKAVLRVCRYKPPMAFLVEQYRCVFVV
jgi:hypothetical protein